MIPRMWTGKIVVLEGFSVVSVDVHATDCSVPTLSVLRLFTARSRSSLDFSFMFNLICWSTRS